METLSRPPRRKGLTPVQHAEFARKIKSRRERLGLTQAQLAKKTGLSLSLITHAESRGEYRRGSRETLEWLVSFLEAAGKGAA